MHLSSCSVLEQHIESLPETILRSWPVNDCWWSCDCTGLYVTSPHVNNTCSLSLAEAIIDIKSVALNVGSCCCECILVKMQLCIKPPNFFGKTEMFPLQQVSNCQPLESEIECGTERIRRLVMCPKMKQHHNNYESFNPLTMKKSQIWHVKHEDLLFFSSFYHWKLLGLTQYIESAW